MSKSLRERCQHLWEGSHINGWDDLESFAREIRNEALEEAKNVCIARGNLFQGANIGTWEEAAMAYKLGDKIRGLKTDALVSNGEQ
jgi:hypothetical protein